MNLQEVLSAIQSSGLENAGSLADFVRNLDGDRASVQQQLDQITTERDRLADNNPQLLGQLKSARRERDQWKEKYQGIATQFMQDGDDEEAAAKRLENLTAEVEALKTARTEAEQARDQAIDQVNKLTGEVTLRDVSAKLGVPSVLLKPLVPVDPANYVIGDDGVFIKVQDGEETKQVSWSEFLEQQPPEIRQALNVKPTENNSPAPANNNSPAPTENSSPAPRKGPSAPPSNPPKPADVNNTLGKLGFKGPSAAKKGD